MSHVIVILHVQQINMLVHFSISKSNRKNLFLILDIVLIEILLRFSNFLIESASSETQCLLDLIPSNNQGNKDTRFVLFLAECSAATTDHAKHALSTDCTLITALFINNFPR